MKNEKYPRRIPGFPGAHFSPGEFRVTQVSQSHKKPGIIMHNYDVSDF